MNSSHFVLRGLCSGRDGEEKINESTGDSFDVANGCSRCVCVCLLRINPQSIRQG